MFFAYTLDEAARLAMELTNAEKVADSLPNVAGKRILGLFTGGTLASETAMLLSEALGVPQDAAHAEGYMLHADGHAVIDLGDDVYTRGRPHPMIDPSVRTERIDALVQETDFGVLLMDVVLGFGSHADPAGAVAEAVKAVREKRGEPLVVIASVTGTEEDPQVRSAQIEKLREAGIVITSGPRESVMLAVRLTAERKDVTGGEAPTLLTKEPQVINIGLREFAQDMQTCGVRCVFHQWAPACQGDERLQKLLALMQ